MNPSLLFREQVGKNSTATFRISTVLRSDIVESGWRLVVVLVIVPTTTSPSMA